MTAKVEKVEIYNKGAPSIKLSDALSTRSSDHVTDKKRYICASARPMATKWWVLMRVCYPESHITC